MTKNLLQRLAMKLWGGGGWRKQVQADLAAIRKQLDRIEAAQQEESMDLTALADKVAAEGTVVDSAVVLLGQLTDLIRANATDPAAIQAIADSVDAQRQKLADSVVANTPAA